jgi:hypothetical protein
MLRRDFYRESHLRSSSRELICGSGTARAI